MDKISCIMLCYNMDRLENLRRAAKCFYYQSCNNHIELVVLCNGTEEHYNAVKEIVEEEVGSKIIVDDNDMSLVIQHRDKKKEHLSIGDLRNIAVGMSSGDIIVPWDDDDLNHYNRLDEQYKYMVEQGADACFLSDHLHYFEDHNKLFWVNWGYEIPNTMMCRRKCFDDLEYPSMNHHEDSKLAKRIRDNFKSCTMQQRGYLFTYCFTNSSIFGFDHHMNNIALGKDLSYMTDWRLKLKSLCYIRGYELEFLQKADYMNPNHPLLQKV